jgi:hypothetical protein
MVCSCKILFFLLPFSQIKFFKKGGYGRGSMSKKSKIFFIFVGIVFAITAFVAYQNNWYAPGNFTKRDLVTWAPPDPIHEDTLRNYKNQFGEGPFKVTEVSPRFCENEDGTFVVKQTLVVKSISQKEQVLPHNNIKCLEWSAEWFIKL